MSASPFRGSLVALPTPLRDRRLDLDALRGLVELHARSATSGLVVCGTTGESCTLTGAEKQTLFVAAVRFAAGRLPVIAGVGTNDTRSTVANALLAQDCGVDGLLVVTPYYNRPNASGLHLHFGALAGSVALPTLLYNVPTRTGLDLGPALTRELFEAYAPIVGIKEVTSSPERIRALLAIEGLGVYCGEDSALAEFARAGAHGAVGVVSNLAPDETDELLRVAADDPVRAAELEEMLAPLLRGLYLETNPVPLKAALAHEGRCTAEVRPPLGPLSAAHARELEELLGVFCARRAGAEAVRDRVVPEPLL